MLLCAPIVKLIAAARETKASRFYNNILLYVMIKEHSIFLDKVLKLLFLFVYVENDSLFINTLNKLLVVREISYGLKHFTFYICIYCIRMFHSGILLWIIQSK